MSLKVVTDGTMKGTHVAQEDGSVLRKVQILDLHFVAGTDRVTADYYQLEEDDAGDVIWIKDPETGDYDAAGNWVKDVEVTLEFRENNV